MVLNGHAISFQDIAELIRNIVVEVFFVSNILGGHQILVQPSVDIIKQLACLVNLRHISIIWNLVQADSCVHSIASLEQLLVRFFLGTNSISNRSIILCHLLLKLVTNRLKISHSFEVILVGVKLRSKQQIALVGKYIDISRNSHFNVLLVTDFLSEHCIYIISLLSLGSNMCVQTFNSLVVFLDIILLLCNLRIKNLSLELFSLVLLF